MMIKWSGTTDMIVRRDMKLTRRGNVLLAIVASVALLMFMGLAGHLETLGYW